MTPTMTVKTTLGVAIPTMTTPRTLTIIMRQVSRSFSVFYLSYSQYFPGNYAHGSLSGNILGLY